jgi:hypothetical protein
MTTTVKKVDIQELDTTITPSAAPKVVRPDPVLMSDDIGKLAIALSRVQGEIVDPIKDAANPYFKSSYADLQGVLEVVRPLLSKFEMAVTQLMAPINGTLALVTMLTHSSGQWMRSITPLYMKDSTSQAMGSSITYARRYALAAIIGLFQKDDDGNEATRGTEKVHPMAGKPAYQGGR